MQTTLRGEFDARVPYRDIQAMMFRDIGVEVSYVSDWESKISRPLASDFFSVPKRVCDVSLVFDVVGSGNGNLQKIWSRWVGRRRMLSQVVTWWTLCA